MASLKASTIGVSASEGGSPGNALENSRRWARIAGVAFAGGMDDAPTTPAGGPAMGPMVVESSLYATLERRGLRPVRALQRLAAANLRPADAELLSVAPGSAALKIERVSYLPDGRVIEFTRSFYRGDAYDFVAELNTLP